MTAAIVSQLCAVIRRPAYCYFGGLYFNMDAVFKYTFENTAVQVGARG